MGPAAIPALQDAIGYLHGSRYNTRVNGPQSPEDEVFPEAWGADQSPRHAEETAPLFGGRWRITFGVALGLAAVALCLVFAPR